ncbi:UDP pyrophosphate phosphatase [Streptomyces griseoaurantiacus]|uniref:UDP pyrophosphate phosphatase n=1 Tax=Streptomyces griseoaurantiacus TaxID=68213 RepID=UPI002E2D34A1|nr:UDP pyrophosphate phosphatase [Streptomyces jietaisiensis]
MRFISSASFMPFVRYRIALGLAIIALVAAGALSPHAAESAGRRADGPVRGAP